MLFSSIPFLYYFLPLVLAVYFLTPARFRNAVLLLASLIFYAWGEPKYVLLMLASILSGYGFGLLQEQYRGQKGAKLVCGLSVAVSLSFLLYFKYADFFLENFNAATGLGVPLLRIALPIGISFYTFQIISYTVDVYRGEPAQKNLIHLAAYVAMFPQLIAGPIVRYSDIAQQLEHRSHSTALAAEGVRRFLIGLGKKILIANQLGELCSVFRASDEKSVLFYWLYAVAFALHIYFDFSGYSDMAIGLGKVFGFHFLENFNYPYISASITEFWRRWHMSLGTWFRDYVYIPLGGNRVGRARQLLNILVVWMLTGFWHGAAWNFVVWGLMFAVLLIMEKLWLLKPLSKCRPLAHLYVVFFVVISFVIFNAENMGQALSDIGGLFGAGGIPLVSAEAVYCLRSFALVLILAVLGATPLLRNGLVRLSQYPTAGKVLNALEPFTLFILLLVMTGYLVDGSFNPFLYFRF
ncbi:MBOAT family O-acyltransferase [Flavonifractor plautii]|jgi:alginate O-acetyltransferase complex protein AlgI|uniref:MBOAT family O-acyltransferase n=1 Tax=Flavonifractor plautii TaxID=292800 RepID=UPI00189820D1|nr:MBOAT family protein [Flavonifractor plautii]MCB5779776.1 MBOAT family protein [Flavonifractor plautii]MCB7042526.1 MBOAT family protein [Flavonifractor plautii]MCG4657592.1 MBOAT family protein [Flavonifractor plautii]MCG4707560.1 MBOAT family protein [Flavonifractor plautii]MDB7869241.1 MBOAT family protein [Flavonifractor plautii]